MARREIRFVKVQEAYRDGGSRGPQGSGEREGGSPTQGRERG